MHPLRVEQPWPYDNWWVAATSDEIGREPLGLTVLNQPLVLYRTESGEAVCLYGICPHRSFMLAKGCIDGDNLRCGYHGFAFAPSGECVDIPSQASVPKGAATIRRYPLVERNRLVWIWTGSAESADPALIPDAETHGLADGWAVEVNEPAIVNCRYTLLIDNLMDLSHISYIHADTIPGGGGVVQIPPKMIETENSLNVERVGHGIPSNPYFRLQWPEHEGAVDYHFDAEYFSPAMIRTGGRGYAHDSGKELGTQNFLHLLTPVTASSVRYQVLTTRNYNLQSKELSNFLMAANGPEGAVSSQDVAALELIEQTLQSLDHAPTEVSCRVDTGALKVRHRLEKQIRAEIGGDVISLAAHR